MTKKNRDDKTNEQLVKRFEDLAIIHRSLETPRKASKAFDEQIEIWAEVKKRGPAAIDLFLGLLKAQDAAVRLNSAGLSLFVAAEQAERHQSNSRLRPSCWGSPPA